MTTRIPLDSGMVQSLAPTEGTDSQRYWISPFDVPQAAEVDPAGPGLVRSIRFHYLEEAVGKGGRSLRLDPKTDPEVDLSVTDPTGKVVVVQFKPPADARALERVADRLGARAAEEKVIARRFSLLMTARVLQVWADRFAGTEGSGRPEARPQQGDA